MLLSKTQCKSKSGNMAWWSCGAGLLAQLGDLTQAVEKRGGSLGCTSNLHISPKITIPSKKGKTPPKKTNPLIGEIVLVSAHAGCVMSMYSMCVFVCERQGERTYAGAMTAKIWLNLICPTGKRTHNYPVGWFSRSSEENGLQCWQSIRELTRLDGDKKKKENDTNGNKS